MKKIMRKYFSITLVVLLCILNATSAMAASSRYSRAVASYQRYMRMQNGRYRIVDIDGNGIPELLAHTWRNEVYTYNPKTGKMVCVGAIAYGKGYNMPIVYSKTSHTVMISSYNTGGSVREIYKINGVKFRRLVEAEAFNGKFDNGYKVNGKRVSQYTYNKSISRYMKKPINFNVR